MKILKEPEENTELWKKAYSCTGEGWDQEGKTACGRLLEVNIRDLRRRRHTDIGGGTDTYYGFTCPKCRCFTEIPEKDIPRNLMHMIKDYRR